MSLGCGYPVMLMRSHNLQFALLFVVGACVVLGALIGYSIAGYRVVASDPHGSTLKASETQSETLSLTTQEQDVVSE
eukprot:975871-Prymnesium_polylepis.1